MRGVFQSEVPGLLGFTSQKILRISDFNYSKLLTNHLLRFYIAIKEQLFVLKISLFSAIWNLGTITALPFSN